MKRWKKKNNEKSENNRKNCQIHQYWEKEVWCWISFSLEVMCLHTAIV